MRGAVQREQLLHGGDALGVEAALRARADAGQIAEFEVGDGAWQLRGQQADEAVGLLHVAGDLGEVAVGRHADGAAQGVADVGADGLLDGEGDLARARRLALAADELADHLVDRGVCATGQSGRRPRRCAGSSRRSRRGGRDEDNLRADALGLAHLRAGPDAEGLGLVAGGDAAGGVGHPGDDGERAAAVLGVELLLDRGEEAVEVDVQEGEAVGRGGCSGVGLEGI